MNGVFMRCFISPAAIAAIAGSLGLASVTQAQWTVTNLNPSGAVGSYANAAAGGQQTGYAFVGGVLRASLWLETAESWVDLHPAAATESFAYASDGGQQAGYGVVGGISRAGGWSGTSAAWVDLHP
ncbi:MAG: hypothetical protein ACK5ZV_13425, partial [bacterium]